VEDREGSFQVLHWSEQSATLLDEQQLEPTTESNPEPATAGTAARRAA
jgi:hypothetical protein